MAKLKQTGGLTMPAKIILGLIIIAGLFFGVRYAKSSGLLGKAQEKANTISNKMKGPEIDVINVLLCPFGGYAGGPYFNNGFEASEDSRYFTEYGFKVQFHVADNEAQSLEEWKSGKYDVHWQTAGALSTKFDLLAPGYPKLAFAVDRSDGADALIGVRGIKKVSHLKGKKIAVAFDKANKNGNPSFTGLLCILKANGMTIKDVKLVFKPTPIEAAQAYIKGEVHAAMVWAPDDKMCVGKVPGTNILITSKLFPNAIFDGMVINENSYNEKPLIYQGLAAGWLKGNGEINNASSAKSKAADILSKGFNDGQSAGDYLGAINGVRLLSYADNYNLYGLNAGYRGITLSKVFNNSQSMYNKNGIQTSGTWDDYTLPACLKSLNADNYTSPGDKAERKKTFTKMAADEISKDDEFAAQSARIRFPSGKASLTETTKDKLDAKFSATLEEFETMRVLIVGHTDNVGDPGLNRKLSKKRASSVKKFFVNEYGFDANRFNVKGAGEDKPIASNSTGGGRAKNRRVEIILLQN